MSKWLLKMASYSAIENCDFGGVLVVFFGLVVEKPKKKRSNY